MTGLFPEESSHLVADLASGRSWYGRSWRSRGSFRAASSSVSVCLNWLFSSLACCCLSLMTRYDPRESLHQVVGVAVGGHLDPGGDEG